MGLKTSEFWVAVAVPVIIAGAKLLDIEFDTAALTSVVTTAIAYILSRTAVKATAADK